MRHARPVRLAALAAALTLGSAALAAGSATAVTGPAVPAATTTYAYTAQVIVGEHDRGCSGVLVDREWLLTAASCFVDNPAAGLTVPAGKPALKTTTTIGRADLSGTGGAVREIVELVPRTDRDAVLARLNRPVTNVTPIALATAAPTAGEELTLAGFGRSTTEWAPFNLHTGAFSVDASTATNATVTGKNGAAACLGDSGGPLVRTVNGTSQLAALSSQSYQGGCLGIAATETRTGGIATRVDDLASWVNSKTGAVRVTDFNCDGVEDIAVADPQATVGGDANAGLVRVVYGGGKGTAEINQNLDWVPGATEAGDWFGESLATVDHDEDGCTDLVVGTAGEDIGAAVDAGTVDVLHGAPGGLGTGVKKNTHFEQGTGSGAIGTSAAESGDRMGDAIAAGTTTAGEPYLIIGVPGESVGTLAKAGAVYYLRGTTNISVGQDSTNVPDTAEANDGFGGAIAADGNHFAVGSPGEAVGSAAGAGMATVFSHTLNSEGRPTPRFGLDQDLDAISGGADAGDQFGSALAMVPYRPSGAAAATESILAVGIWGEDLTIDGAAKDDAGAVLTFRIPASGTFTQFNSYLQGTDSDDTTGTSQANDRFGWTVTAVNTAPRAVSTVATMKLAVGVPQETVDAASNAGVIHTFSLVGLPGANDRWLKPGDGFGIPGLPGANQYLGRSLHFTGTNLYVGMPNGPSTYGALYALPMANVTAGATATAITTYRPGTGGLPSAGVRFGWTAR
ncbi:trypsin-like serine protease [Streptomyces sp. SID12488]|uniref:S1 family peptidase n=1 Tax=Streptomyces sp. SID12488 TaxID=2706040 RepID=UPI0013DBDA40|nr:trypsin-like serine protease [Streptomyces sp. SID12488]NEA65574.1 S1 family peptidase [Streptomyces sp. SID12488]